MATTTRRRRRAADDTKAPSADRYRDEPDDDDDLDEEESPRARRRRERDEEPAGRSRRSRDADDDDDEPDEPRGRRGRRARDDDEDEDEEDEPRGRRGRRSRDEDEDEDDEDDEPRGRRGRRSRDDDEEDEDEPRRGRGKGKSSAGWDAWGKKRSQLGNFNDLRIPDDGTQTLLKFMDDEPFCSYGVHWLQLKQGRRSFTCLEDGCPLCDKLGDSPKAMGAFNILVLDEDADPKLMVWAASPAIMQLIESKSKARTGPLTKEYYAVSKTKSGKSGKGAVTYALDVVRSRDLKAEWGVKPLTDATLDKFEGKLYDEEKFLKPSTKQELRAVCREAMDDDD